MFNTFIFVLLAMANLDLAHEDFASDTDDDDYVPDGAANEGLSEEDNSGDNENVDDGKGKKKTKKNKKKAGNCKTIPHFRGLQL